MTTRLCLRLCRRAIPVVPLLAVFFLPASAAELLLFTSRSFSEIRAANEGRPLVVSFWSVNCEPCKAEMAVLKRMHRAHPAVRVVLVSADPPALRPIVVRFLHRNDLGGFEIWQFGDEPEERLRYSVDRTWRGELPRAYFFDGKGGRTAHSGLPDEAWVEAWFAQAAPVESRTAPGKNADARAAPPRP